MSRDHEARGGNRIATALPDDAAECGLVRGEVLERARPGPPVAEVWVGDLEPVLWAAGGIGPDAHQLGGSAERQRTKQHRLHHAEERGDRADTEREGEYRGERDGEVAMETAKREAKIGEGHQARPAVGGDG